MKVLKAIGFWVASFTWGLPMTLVGCLVAIALMITGHRPRRFHYFIYFEVGEGCSGFNCGCFFVTCRSLSSVIKLHESGHGLQNIMLGVFMPFVIAIPSVVRYWYREYLVHSGKRTYRELPPYDSIWFEGWATKLGRKYFAN